MHSRNTLSAWLVLGICLTQTLVRADLIYFRPDEPIVFGIGAYDLDLNFDGLTDIQLETTGTRLLGNPTLGNAILGIPKEPPDVGSFVLPLQLADLIGEPPSSPNEWVDADDFPTFVSCMNVGCIGLWQYPNDDAYFGLQFDIDGATHYGWIHLENSMYGVQATIHEWGYESTPDTGVFAGVIPEPSTTALFLVGLGLLYFRKKRIR
ncbi:MAG: PEP-CTERM sorting domain-containing protein [Spartobacteria bacterium]|nr:PEP-CTERM sorting domain-containing protein [Spartobacteria bacterium]